MNTSSVARILHASTQTVHRWTSTYRAFLQTDAAPANGFARVFREQDVRILKLVSQLRGEGLSHEDIEAQLKRMAADDWNGLPDVPSTEDDGSANITVPSGYLTRRERQIAGLERVTEQLQESVLTLQLGEERIQKLLADLESLQRTLDEKVQGLGGRDELIAHQSDLHDTRKQINELAITERVGTEKNQNPLATDVLSVQRRKMRQIAEASAVIETEQAAARMVMRRRRRIFLLTVLLCIEVVVALFAVYLH